MFEITKDDLYEINTLFRALGCTYPSRTLRRRLGLLTPTERRKFFAKLNKALNLAEGAEDILCVRASKENDKWP